MRRELENVGLVLLAVLLGMLICALIGCKTRYKATEVVRHDTLTIRDTAYVVRQVLSAAHRQDSTERHRWATEVVRVTVYDTIGRVVQTTDIAKQSGSATKQGSKAEAQVVAAETQTMSHTEAAGHIEQASRVERIATPLPWWVKALAAFGAVSLAVLGWATYKWIRDKHPP